MQIGRLMDLLDKWQMYMKSDSNNLGYPKKSLGMTTGGESNYDAFDIMYEASEQSNIHTIDAIIDSLEPLQKQAIYARFLRGKKPTLYEHQLQLAIDNLLTIASRRIEA